MGVLWIASPAAGDTLNLLPSATDLPSVEQVVRVASLRDYNTRLVVLSTALLGVASGLIGSFLLLRKRSLMGDALSHATLPGIGIAFLVMVIFGMAGGGKALPGLLIGAVVTGGLGILAVLAIRNTTRLKDDAAMGIVLSVFFGLGVAVLGLVQSEPRGSAAGLESFIYGKTASMVMRDFVLIASVAGAVAVVSLLLFKEFTLLCFDEAFAGTQGWPVNVLDLVMLALVTAVTVVGLQAVGLILIIAFLITPAAAARFWTDDLRRMMFLAGLIGGASGWLGASLSALLPRLPAGAVIVLVAAGIFLFSMVFGPPRGVLMRTVRHRRLKRKVGRQHLLRAMYELLEEIPDASASKQASASAYVRNLPVSFTKLINHRSWTRAEVRRLIRQADGEDHIEAFDGHMVGLSESGFGEAARVTRNHRLWEMYLIRHADIAPAQVDRGADAVEHVLGAEMVRKLEEDLLRRKDALAIPPSPHALRVGIVNGES